MSHAFYIDALDWWSWTPAPFLWDPGAVLNTWALSRVTSFLRSHIHFLLRCVVHMTNTHTIVFLSQNMAITTSMLTPNPYTAQAASFQLARRLDVVWNRLAASLSQSGSHCLWISGLVAQLDWHVQEHIVVEFFILVVFSAGYFWKYAGQGMHIFLLKAFECIIYSNGKSS